MTSRSRAEDDVTTSLVVVVLVFLVCQLMNPIRRLMAEILPASQRGCPSDYLFFSNVSSTFVILNSSVNFEIYTVCGRRFRQRLLRLLLRKGGQVGPTTMTNTMGQGSQTADEGKDGSSRGGYTVSTLPVHMNNSPDASIPIHGANSH